MSNPSSEKLKSDNATDRFAWQVATAVFCRVILNTARRFAYPFAPALSRGLSVPLTAVTSIIAVNQASALLGMFFGPLADRLGYRRMMLAALGMLVVGVLAAGFLPLYGMVMVALFLGGLGKTIFDPAVQAYMSERIPYERRGRVIGLLEFAWSGSTLLGIPLMGVLIAWQGWRAPFFALGGLGLCGYVALEILIPKDKEKNVTESTRVDFWKIWRNLIHDRPVLGVIGFAFFCNIANDNLFVIYGAWLEESFQLSIVALGFSTMIAIGLAEISGEGMTTFFADRLGLKRSMIWGQTFSLMSNAILPFLGHTLPLALIGLFFIFISWEFTFVTGISLGTELIPGSRATMMSGFFAAAGLGRIVGALIGGHVWLAGGILATAIVSTVASGIALAALIWGLRIWTKR